MRQHPRAWLAAALLLGSALPPCVAGERLLWWYRGPLNPETDTAFPSITWKSEVREELRWLPDPSLPAGVVVECLRGWSLSLEELKNRNLTEAEWHRILAVYVDPKERSGEVKKPAMAGTYRITKDALIFEPRFPLTPGLSYRAVLRPPVDEGGTRPFAHTAIFTVPPRHTEGPTHVAQVYPTAAKLPENLLKFYVHFTAPMKRGDTYKHIHLLHEKGEAVDLPFLELDEELWNPEMTRLTLIIDPGRIKRGVKPLEDVGPALEAGKEMKLVIDPAWEDAAGAPLAQKFEKTFVVVAPDREPVAPILWKVIAPTAGRRAALEIQFGESMDAAITQRVIQVRDKAGRAVEGTASLTENEKGWHFVPAEAWKLGKFEIVLPASIEDLAGKQCGETFRCGFAREETWGRWEWAGEDSVRDTVERCIEGNADFQSVWEGNARAEPSTDWKSVLLSQKQSAPAAEPVGGFKLRR